MSASVFSLPIRHARQLGRFKDLIASQVFAERRAKVIDLFLGSLWSLLGPVLEMAVYFFLIVIVFDRADFGGVPAFLGIMVGLVHYRVFQMTVQRSIPSIVGGRKILLQVRVEPMAFVGVAFLKQLMDARYYIPLVLLTALSFRFIPSSSVIYYPFVFILVLIASWGVSLLGACAYIYLRDLQLMSQTVLRLMLYSSPIIYPTTLIGDEWRVYYFLNPFATLFGLVQSSLFGMPWPPIWHVLGSVVFFTLLVLFAHAFYQRRVGHFTKIL